MKRMDYSKAPMFRWGFVGMWLGLLLTIAMGVGGDLLARMSKSAGGLLNEMTGLAVVVMLAGVGLMIYSCLYPPKQSSADKSHLKPVSTNALDEPPKSIPLPKPSLVEHTTYPLETKRPESSSR